MRKIYVGFSKPKNRIFPIFSWAIRALEGTDFSHVYVRQETHYGVDIIYQASGSQVNFMSGVLFSKEAKTLREFAFEITDDAYDKYMKFALMNAGKPYGVLQAFGIAFYYLLCLERNPLSNGKADYVCSELVAEILFEIGRFKYDRELFDRLTPKDLYEFCLKNSSNGAVL